MCSDVAFCSLPVQKLFVVRIPLVEFFFVSRIFSRASSIEENPGCEILGGPRTGEEKVVIFNLSSV